MEIDISLYTLFALIIVAFIAGCIDAIAGGGGMITIPALLMAGIPPLEALGTNKFQSSFGSFGASVHFYKRGHIELKKHLPFVVVVFCASMLGSLCVQSFESTFLRKCIPFLLIIFALYFLFAPKITQDSHRALVGAFPLGIVLGTIGFYDGFFGPGTGSFFMLAFIVLGGFNILQSLAHAKLLNFATNLASVLIFAFSGKILWIVGLCMALGQFAGANLGSHLATFYGMRLIKPLVVIVSLCACANLLYKEYF